MKILILLISALSWVTFATAQDTKSRLDSSDISLPSPIEDNAEASSGDAAVSSSDTGAQRPVSLSESGFSGTFGYSSKIAYKENPLGAPGDLGQQADAVWENSFYGNAKLGVFETDSSVITPYVGAKWAITDFTYKNVNEAIPDLSVFNFNSTSAYLLFLMQHESGWALRGGVIYANDRSTEKDTEDYMEFYPSVGITKAFALSDSALGIFDLSAGIHLGDHEDADGPVIVDGNGTITGDGHTADELDHFDITASYSVLYSFEKFTLKPGYSISYREYDNGFNTGRSDILHNLSIHADYPIGESVSLSLFSDYSKRESSGTDVAGDPFGILFDFKKFDLGAGISLEARF